MQTIQRMSPDGSPLAFLAQQWPEAANLIVAEKSAGVPQRKPSVSHNDRVRRARSEAASSASPNRYLAENDRRQRIIQNRQRIHFYSFEVRYVPRLDNRDADHLALIASSRVPILSYIIIEKLTKPLVKAVEPLREADLMIIDGAEQQPEIDWMSSIKTYLDNQPISNSNAEIECIARKFRMYHLIDGVLYGQGTNDMMMRCISKKEGSQLLWDIHIGVCGAQSSWRSIVGKAFRHRCYWSTAKDDAMKIVTKCKDCQFFQKQITKHANPFRSIDLS
jgi:hypothetical protein